METYETPKIEITMFQAEDVITTSGDTFDDGDTGIWT